MSTQEVVLDHVCFGGVDGIYTIYFDHQSDSEADTVFDKTDFLNFFFFLYETWPYSSMLILKNA